MEVILKRVHFQIGEPRTDGDISVNLCKWGVGQVESLSGDHYHRVSKPCVCFPVSSWSFSPTGTMYYYRM